MTELSRTSLLRAIATLAIAASTTSLAVAQTSTRTYTHDRMGNRTAATNEVVFQGARVFRVEPGRALIGERINIYGRNFPAAQIAATQVTFAGTPGTVLSVAERVITAEVPPSFTGGRVEVSFFGGTALDAGFLAAEGVVISPAEVALDYGQTTQFAATVVGKASQQVNWSVAGIPGGNASVGTITPGGLYTAPAITSGGSFPFLIEAQSPGLAISGYALARLACSSAAPLPNRTLVAGTLSSPFERHCYEFSGVALRHAFVAFLGTGTVRSMVLRSSDGTIIDTAGSGTTLTINRMLPVDDTYRIEIQGAASAGGNYQIWLDHSEYAPGVWLLPADGEWDDVRNWSRRQMPVARDAVIIGDMPGGDFTVSVRQGARTCASLQCAENLALRGASLNVASSCTVDGSLVLDGGTLAAVNVVSPNPVMVTASSTLDDVILDADAVIAPRNANNSINRLTILGDLELNGTITMTGGFASRRTEILLPGDQSIDGTGTVFLDADNGVAGDAFVRADPGGTLTIESGVTIRGRGFLGRPDAALVNRGTILGDVTGRTLRIDGQPWSNESLVRAADGGIAMQGTWTNNGTVEAATLGTVALGGETTTAAFGNLVNSGGTFAITGTIDNANSTISLVGKTGSWRMAGATIRGGAISSPTLPITITGDSTLEGVTINVDATIVPENGNNSVNRLTVLGDVIIHGTITMTGGFAGRRTEILLPGSQTIRGTGSVRLDADNGVAGDAFIRSDIGGTLTIDAGVTIRGRGFVGRPDATLVNLGLIEADASGRTLRVDGQGWSNQGTVRAAAGTAQLLGSWTNAGNIEAATGGTASLGGTITTAAFGNLVSSGGTFAINGAVDNSSSTITLVGTTGTWRLEGATITGGTISSSNLPLTIAADSTVDNVVINADVEIIPETNNNSVNRLTVRNDFELNGTVTMTGGFAGRKTEILLPGSQSIRGSGSVCLDADNGVAGDAFVRSDIGGTLTIEAGVTVRGRGFLGRPDANLVNLGTIDADVAGRALRIEGTNWSNQGTIRATAGSARLLGAWTNTGNIEAAPGGTASLGGTLTTAAIGNLIQSGGTFAITGAVDNANSTISLTGTSGAWHLAGATITGGTIASSNLRLTIAADSTLDSVLVNTDVDIVPETNNNSVSRLTVLNDFVLNGAVTMTGGFANRDTEILLPGNQSIRGSGSIFLNADNGTSGEAFVRSDAGGTLTIETGITVHGRGFLGRPGTSLVNNGTVAADFASRTLTISGDVTSNSMLAIDATCRVAVSGDLVLTPTATYAIELAGTAVGAFSRLDVTGSASIDGTAAVTLAGGFAPTAGDAFAVLTYGSQTGTFASMTGLNVGATTLAPTYGASQFVLTAQ